MEINQAILSFGLKYTGVAGQEYEMMSPVDNSEKLSRRMALEEAAAAHSQPMPLSAIEERLSGVRSAAATLPEIAYFLGFFISFRKFQIFSFTESDNSSIDIFFLLLQIKVQKKAITQLTNMVTNVRTLGHKFQI